MKNQRYFYGRKNNGYCPFIKKEYHSVIPYIHLKHTVSGCVYRGIEMAF